MVMGTDSVSVIPAVTENSPGELSPPLPDSPGRDAKDPAWVVISALCVSRTEQSGVYLPGPQMIPVLHLVTLA